MNVDAPPKQVLAAQDERAIIPTNNVPLDLLRSNALRAIGAACNASPFHPPLVVFGTALKRPECEGAAVRLTECDPVVMRHVLSNVALWRQAGDNGGKWVFPPLDLAKDLMVSPWGGVPVCDGVVNHPVLTKRGLRFEAGFDESSGVWIAGRSVDAPAPGVSDEQVQEAIAELDYLFQDFPFVADADRANLYSMLFTAIVRRVIDGPVPMFVSEAPAPGSGKSLMLEVAGMILVGDDVMFHAMPKYEDERAKALPVWARDSELVLLDNVDGKLESPYLEMMLTAPSIGYRTLGLSQQQYFPMRSIVAVSGNNVIFDKALFRRCIFSQIDPQMEHPENRQGFQIENIKGYVREHRSVLLGSLLTVVQAWVERGAVRSKHVMGSYDEWAKVVGGILDVAGLGDAFLANRDGIRAEKTADDEAVNEFIEAWYGKYGALPTPSRKLFYLAATAPPVSPGITLSGEQMLEREEYQGLLAEIITGFGEAGQRKSLGHQLKRWSGRVFGEYRLSRYGRSNGDTLWCLKAVNDGKR